MREAMPLRRSFGRLPVLPLVLLLSGIASAKVISVMPGVASQALATFYIANCTTSLGVGSYSLSAIPMYGTVTFGTASGVAPGCPVGSPSLPATVANYTLNASTPPPTGDYFQLTYKLPNGTVGGVYDIFVVNGNLIGKQLGVVANRPGLTPCNCSGETSAGGFGTGIAANSTGPPGSDTTSLAAPPGSGSAPDAGNPHRRFARSGIDVSSGNVFYSVTDYTTSGQNPLSFTRYYNGLANLPVQIPLPELSATLSSTLAAGLGPNWRSNYDRYLKITSATTVIAERPDGQQLNFTLTGSTWTPDADIDMTLTKSGSLWTLTDTDDTVETYTTATLPLGVAAVSLYAQLSTIQLRNGYEQTLNYGGNVLASVTDSYNRTLTFTYSSGLLQSVTTPDTLVLSYGYTSGQLTTVSYSTSPVTSQTYLYGVAGQPSLLTGITDENGSRYATWGYDASEHGASSSLGTGANATTLAYYADGSRIVTNAFGVADTYRFTTLQNIPKLTEIDRAPTSTTAVATELLSYDASGYLASQTDWNGNKTTFVNNAHGYPTTINEAVGTPATRTTTITYDSTWIRLPSAIVTTGITAAFAYDSSGEQLTKTLTDTTTSTIPYSTHGQTRTWTNTWSNYLLASSKTPNGNRTQYGYDSSGALTSVTDPLSHVTNIIAHTGGGQPQTVVDPNTVTTTLVYSPRQILLSSTVSGTTGTYKTSWNYDKADNLTQTTLPDNSFVSFNIDSAHRAFETNDSINGSTGVLGDYVACTLDLLGGCTQATTYQYNDPAYLTVAQHSRTFDALERLLVDTGAAGQATTMTYDPDGNALTAKDGLSHTTTNTYDALNRLSASKDANDGITTTSYDTHDRVISVTDANNNTTSYIRNGFGDVIEQISPDSGTSIFSYDGDDNVTGKTDALGIVTQRTYDALDRPLTTTYPASPAENVSFTYDQTGGGFSFGIGRLTSVTDIAGTLTRAYEERGNLATEQRVSAAKTLTTAYAYDAASRVSGITYPDGTVVGYQYDSAGQLSIVTAKPSGASTTTTIATLKHLPFGPQSAVTYGNGIAETWTHDLDYRTTAISDVHGSTNLQKLGYIYDLANNIYFITDSLNAANSQSFAYDAINRLTVAESGTGGFGGYGTFVWTYDKVGNRLTQMQGAMNTTYGYVPGTNRLATISSSTTIGRLDTAPRLGPQSKGPQTFWANAPPHELQRIAPLHSVGQLRPASPRLSGLFGWPILLTGLAGILTLRKRLYTNRLLSILALVALLTGSGILLNGCVTGSNTSSTTEPIAQLVLTGSVHGGQPPVTGAAIQLYAVGTTGDSSAATPLLHTPVMTDASGNFSITSDYTCPSATTLVYLTATGGNPGLATATNNTAIAMMAALGQCGTLSSSTYVFVNEVTTIGSLAALYPYMGSLSTLGSGTTDAANLVSAFALVNEYTNTSTGAVPGPTLPAGYYASSVEINTLGDIVASCINSAGGVAGDGSPCGSFFALALPLTGSAPTDTIQAILNILRFPVLNVAALFNLSSAVGPFQPSLSAAPPSWALPIVLGPATPTFSPAAGTYAAPQPVTLSDSAVGATIYYTTNNGANPTASSTPYTGPIKLTSTLTLKAVAIVSGHSSTVASGLFTITTPPSTVNVITNANGNITGIPTADGTAYATFTYNNANRASSVSGTAVAASYVYDYAGQRFSKTNPGFPAEVYSYSQGAQLIADNNNGTVTDYVYADGRPLAIIQPAATPTANQINYVLTDHLGTPQIVSNTSAATVWSTTYQPFGTTGTISASINQNLRLPGQYSDTETGFSYNLNRDYIPSLGRYLQTDPSGLQAGINTYLYADGNPTVTIDPKGLDYLYVLDPPSAHGLGHAGALVGNESSGWDYYSKLGDDLPLNNVSDHFSSLDDFFQSSDGQRYTVAYRIATSVDQDRLMRSYAEDNLYAPYSTVTNNCATLALGIMNAGGIDIRDAEIVLIPNNIRVRLGMSGLGKYIPILRR
jgi:RHS repeat-associated protein